jgi:D-glycero-alpha-D-manno-heptose 1-phosphate guanylyltransferase
MIVLILAGGIGSRLQSVINNVPKPMADINEKPFLYYLFNYLSKFSINEVILSVGYKKDIIIDYFGNRIDNLNITYSIEDEPLGTGGAIKNSFRLFSQKEDDSIVVINGDTFFDIDLNELLDKHMLLNADITIAVKKMYNFERYGSVSIRENYITDFNEKQFTNEGYINGGVYIINKNLFNKYDEELNRFSFEQYIEKRVNQLKISAYLSEGYFIDIGIPEDYEKAKKNIKLVNNGNI